MISHTTADFRDRFKALPPQVRQQGREAYKLFKQNPYHPSLHFKQVHPVKPLYSARVSKGYRAVAVRKNNTLIWFWIGTHTEYEALISHF